MLCLLFDVFGQRFGLSKFRETHDLLKLLLQLFKTINR